MQRITRQSLIGFASIVVAAILMFAIIPTWVSSPSNVRNIVLSPLFWPYILSGLTVVIGLGLVVTGFFTTDPDEPEPPAIPGGYKRLAILAAIMALTMFCLPRLGMVWTSMLLFAATAFLIRTSHPKTAIICAIAVPLLLYAFFAHVASVAIPQGNFVRLP
ncbi:Tripartite tricarboxylate transporter TctB family protein (plasmid) [Sulfitobacter sp. THAF37]|uniref:tripartite tricarboxylate transporter TctB family protein n=1 Tax=Sulfitobacter sp. THAF37 TaxID=2587855 RepID=UPI001269166C|nr:tripartite tricarboxylate transporter TctB family protein [Sulfitobacter sp. THAF37]QFT60897.1 Tripartite tricarboxylate transporter TctB family protein [Sulfitobacter sp. THAF37]